MTAELPPNAPDLSATQYVLEKLIGEGGFGQAYLAYNQGLRRRCVLKVLTDTSNTGFVARFYREAQVMANLEHPTIPRVYEVATTKAGQPYFAMEYIDGKSLGDHLADEGGVLPLSEACRIVADAAEGLAAAHEIGVVHRDVKLANLLINKRGQVKVIDFGIAKKTVQDGEKTAGIMTVVGQLFGTPRYMSPEQAMAKPLGPPSDLYSLGVVLFILLTGRSPFNGTPHEMMTGHVREPSPTLTGASGEPFPPAIESLMARLLAKNPAARFGSGNELAAALRSVGAVAAAGVGIDAGRPSGFGGPDVVTRESMLSPQPAPTQAAPMQAEPSVAVTSRTAPTRRTDLKLGETVRQMLVHEPSIAVAAIGAARPDVPTLDQGSAYGPTAISQAIVTPPPNAAYLPPGIADGYMHTELDIRAVPDPEAGNLPRPTVSTTWNSGNAGPNDATVLLPNAAPAQHAATSQPSRPMPTPMLRREDSASAPLQVMEQFAERAPPKRNPARVPLLVVGAIALVAGSVFVTKTLLTSSSHASDTPSSGPVATSTAAPSPTAPSAEPRPSSTTLTNTTAAATASDVAVPSAFATAIAAAPPPSSSTKPLAIGPAKPKPTAAAAMTTVTATATPTAATAKPTATPTATATAQPATTAIDDRN